MRPMYRYEPCLKGLPLEKLPPIFIADSPKPCYFFHENACLGLIYLPLFEKLAKTQTTVGARSKDVIGIKIKQYIKYKPQGKSISMGPFKLPKYLVGPI